MILRWTIRVVLVLLLMAAAVCYFHPPARFALKSLWAKSTGAPGPNPPRYSPTSQERADWDKPPPPYGPAPRGPATIQQRLDQYGPVARWRLAAHFKRAGVAYPPDELVLVGIKHTWQLEVWARGKQGTPMRRVATYPILAGSGTLGPKLREGDGQVPEGLYRIESLNPNSSYHLSLRVSYPNDFDRRNAAAEGRRNLGGDIMIHGSNCSVGCLAMGDPASEDLFVMASDTGLDSTSIILTPVDFRVRNLPPDTTPQPGWTKALYQDIRRKLGELK